MKTTLRLMAVLVCFTPVAMAQPQKAPEKPTAPLKIDVPKPRPDVIGKTDLKKLTAEDLMQVSQAAVAKKNYEVAATTQYWYTQKAKTGYYDLACYLAQIGKTEDACYWIQIAAIEEGVDAKHANRDSDLVSLREDKRWKELDRYFQDCNTYFEKARIRSTKVIVPKNYQKTKSIPAILWMHGLGSNPDDFIKFFGQEFADQLNIAVIGVSGTKARGPNRFVWAENIELDAERLKEAIAEAGKQVNIKKGHVITCGFSQGAQVGLEVAAADPETYAGSIALSPGAAFTLTDKQKSPLLAKRAFVVSYGGNEHAGNVLLGKKDAEWLKNANATVIHKPYPGITSHSLPEDFTEVFPQWIGTIIKKLDSK